MMQVICEQVGGACQDPCPEHGVPHEPDDGMCDINEEFCFSQKMHLLCVPTKEDER